MWHRRRSSKSREQRNVHPFGESTSGVREQNVYSQSADPGLTSAAVDSKKHARGRGLGSHELATVSTMESTAPPYNPADVDELFCDGRTSRRTVLADELANGEVDVGRTERTEVGSREHYALAPLHRTSPLMSPFRRSLDHEAGSSTGTGSAHTTRPPTSTARWKTWCATSGKHAQNVAQKPERRRRSLDGGARIAGGPAQTQRMLRRNDLNALDQRSAASTLPPSYHSYPSA